MMSQRSESYFFIGILIVAAVLMVFVFLPELDAIVLGVSLAVLFEPWFRAFRRWLGGKDGPAAALIVLVAVGLIFVPLLFFGFEIFLEAQALYAHVAAGGAVPAADWLRGLFAGSRSSAGVNLGAYAEQVIGLLLNSIGPLVSGVLNVLATFILSFFALYYFLRDGATLRKTVVSWSPLPAERTDDILAKLQAMMGSIVRGSLLVAVAYGVLTGLGFFVFGLPSAILWGGVAGVASFIPGIGVLLIVIPGILTLAGGGHLAAAIGLTIWLFAMSGSVEGVLRPRLIGRRAKIHPMLMLFAVLGGLSFFGPIGLLLGPLALGLLLTLLESYPLFALDNLKKK